MAGLYPHTRETAEETKRRVWQYEGIVVARPDVDDMPWTLRELLKQWAASRYGERRQVSK